MYDAAARRAYGLSLHPRRDRNLAKDATQDVFIYIWLNANLLAPTKSSGGSWILTIVHHRAIDRVRSVAALHQTRKRSWERGRGGDFDATSHGALQLIDDEMVRSALLVLTPSQRRDLELAHFGDLTHTEIATTLGLPLGTASRTSAAA